MRIDANMMSQAEIDQWNVIDCERGTNIKNVWWADDCTHEICIVVDPMTMDDLHSGNAQVKRVRRVLILMQRKLVLVNPVDDYSLSDRPIRIQRKVPA